MSFRYYYIFAVFCLLAVINPLSAQQEQSGCKQRLPETINSYQPSILPVITLDGRFVLFDRKLHPDNIGGINDLDDIWYSRKSDDNSWQLPVHLPDNINTSGSDVIFSITPGGKALLYGTKQGKDNSFSTAQFNGTSWSQTKPLIIKNYYNNLNNYFGNLSADGKTLLLSLERKEGRGKLDIYVCFRLGSGNDFSAPLNIGESINTKNDEGSPFLAYDNRTLYFTSDGRKGFGGKDIYMTRRLDDSWTKWSEPVNLGKSVNSSHDENSVYLTALGDSAIITSWDENSAREGIYFVCIPDSLQPAPYAIVRGKLNAISASSKQEPYQLIVNYDKKNKPDTMFFDGSNYAFVIDSGEFISVIASKKGFRDFGFSVGASNIAYPKFIDYNVSLTEDRPNEILLTKVMFDYDSFSLNDLAFKSMDKVSDLVLFPKEARLKIVGHADKSGSDDYNMKLSRERADAVAKELLKFGFYPGSLEIIAKGKSEPVSEKDEENRRVEIYLIEH